jgi:hypothetical protein
VGTFTMRVTNGDANCPAVNERCIVAVGLVAGARQRIQVTVTKIRFLDPPSPLAVRGDLDIGGKSLIDARADTSCGNKAGSLSNGETELTGSAKKVYGYGDDDPNNKTAYSGPPPSGDVVTGVPDDVFDTFTYSPDELDSLKVIARAQGTYYQGSVTFNAANKVPNGLIFVDTKSGNNIPPSPTDSTDFASLEISGNAAVSIDHIFRGWIIVNGSAFIHGDFLMHGLLYVVNDLVYKGTGTGQIEGAVVSQNVLDTVSTSIDADSDTGGNSTIIYNCKYAKDGDNNVSQSFTTKRGTYKEVAG